MILVTGANGLLGSRLIKRLLENGEKICAFVQPNSSLNLLAPYLSDISIFKGDLLDVIDVQDALICIDYVYHCASITGNTKVRRKKLFKVNVEGTENLVNAALNSTVKKIVYISTVDAIGANPIKGEIDESLSWEKHPYNNDYGLSKQLAEREIMRGISEGLVATIVNPGIILGEGDWENSSGNFWQNGWENSPFNGNGKNGFVDIEDVITFSILAMKNGKNGNRYILVSENVDYQQFYNKIKKNLHNKEVLIKSSKWKKRMPFFIKWIKSKTLENKMHFTNSLIKNADIKFSFANKKALTEFGINFIPLDETIDRISAAFLKTKTEQHG